MSEVTWQKSTYSAEAANCVEIATTRAGLHIRDSKSPAMAHLTIAPVSWADFLRYLAEAGGADAVR
ncbi:DUF397 domain-containing protein [Streptomyces sp. NPDC127190]|uniref:DUF397 domain-containing protein n=1 Tax=unclassified Streptomyces TaxID=2593676 RepID=UPI00363BFAFF